MISTIKLYAKPLLWIGGVLLLCLVGYQWLKYHDAYLEADAKNSVLQQQVYDLKHNIEEAGKREKAKLADIAADLKNPATVKQVVKYIPWANPVAVEDEPRFVPEVLENTSPRQTTASLPDAPSVSGRGGVLLEGDPDKVLGQLRDFGAECVACRIKLESRDAQLADSQKEIANFQQQMDNLGKARRGTFWKRLGHNTKVIVIAGSIGAGVGYVLATRH